jgi:phosphoribosylaminoimidazolecarboxamide formyltransferase/IMP cyclohydrolase
MAAERPTPEQEPQPEYRPVKRALISVFDKTGVVEFARGLHEAGVELISTGGTKRALEEAGLPVTGVEEVTGFPEMLDGRVKTLDPHLYAGILADRRKVEHLETLAEHNLEEIDLVCVNLYPFEETVAAGGTPDEIVEKIDIGGPSMIRAGAKNFHSVVSVCDTRQYERILKEVQEHGGTSFETRQDCALDVFRRTQKYDRAIYEWLLAEIWQD